MTIGDVAMEHWKIYGRNFYSRHDYEGVDSDKANEVYAGVKQVLPCHHSTLGMVQID
jgi:phosphoglucomutase